MVEYDRIKVKDQLGRPEDKAITVKRFREEVVIESNTLFITHSHIGNSLILGNVTNGVLGIKLADNGSQVVLGAASASTTVAIVASPNKVYREHFTDTNFRDTGSATTADWAATAEELAFTSGEIAQSREVAYNDGVVQAATLSVTVKTGSSSDLTLQLSANGGSDWETVTLDNEHTFVKTGSDLRFKFTAAGTVTLSLVKIQYR